MSNMEVAQTILNQLGGTGRLAMMCGCKDFMGAPKAVQFKVGKNAKKVTLCRVELDPSDTYTVRFYTGRSVNLKPVYEMSDVYAESLREIFEQQTGMYLTF